MGHDNHEIEIKLPLPSPAEGRRRLRQAGFRVSRRRVFEANTLFDTPDQSLRRAGTLLRVREVGSRGILTYKGPATIARHKSREELELELTPPDRMHLILSRLGFAPVFRYEKYRAEFSDGAGTAMLDETPIGCFLELEGDAEWIDRSAHALGFTADAYITASYARLYLEYCAGRECPTADMVFPK